LSELLSLSKNKWQSVELSKIDKETIDYIFETYKTVYTHEGMDLSAYSGDELVRKYNAVW